MIHDSYTSHPWYATLENRAAKPVRPATAQPYSGMGQGCAVRAASMYANVRFPVRGRDRVSAASCCHKHVIKHIRESRCQPDSALQPALRRGQVSQARRSGPNQLHWLDRFEGPPGPRWSRSRWCCWRSACRRRQQVRMLVARQNTGSVLVAGAAMGRLLLFQALLLY